MSEEVTLICPVCGRAWTEPSFEEFMKKIEKAWDRWRPLPTYIERYLAQANNPERLKNLLKQKGYLNVFCRYCALAATVASARNVLEIG